MSDEPTPEQQAASIDPERAAAAARTAQQLAAENSFVQVSLAVLTLSRNVYVRAINMLNQALAEAEKDEQIQDAALISETLQLSISSRVDKQPMASTVMQQDTVNVMIPWLDTLIQRDADFAREMAEQQAQEAAETPESEGSDGG